MIGVVDLLVIFFFQAEDGIRDDLVTGVQTCALPISRGGGLRHRRRGIGWPRRRPPRARDRKSVVKGKSVDLGGRRIIKKKQPEEKKWVEKENEKENKKRDKTEKDRNI